MPLELPPHAPPSKPNTNSTYLDRRTIVLLERLGKNAEIRKSQREIIKKFLGYHGHMQVPPNAPALEGAVPSSTSRGPRLPYLQPPSVPPYGKPFGTYIEPKQPDIDEINKLFTRGGSDVRFDHNGFIMLSPDKRKNVIKLLKNIHLAPCFAREFNFAYLKPEIRSNIIDWCTFEPTQSDIILMNSLFPKKDDSDVSFNLYDFEILSPDDQESVIKLMRTIHKFTNRSSEFNFGSYTPIARKDFLDECAFSYEYTRKTLTEYFEN